MIRRQARAFCRTGRKGDNYGWAARIDAPESRAAAQAERQFIRVTGGDCTSPCAAHAQISGSELKLTGLYYKETPGVLGEHLCD